MSGQTTVVRLIQEQRRRVLAGIMGHAEQASWWRKLSPDEQRALRAKVIESVGVFSDLFRDILKVTEEDSVRNDLVVDLLQQIHAGQKAMHRDLLDEA